MKTKVLHNKIIVEKIQPPLKSKGGILLVSEDINVPAEGEILAVGPGKLNKEGVFRPLDVRVGDRILFGRHSGTPVKITEEEEGVSKVYDVLIMTDEDVLAVTRTSYAE